MASKKFLVDIDLRNNQLTNSSLQNLTVHPSTGGKQPGWIYFNTIDNTTWVWTGSVWLDLGRYYTHATPGALNPVLTGANVLATLTTNNEGHVLTATTRTLTLGDLGYSPYVHPPYAAINQTLSGATVVATFKSDTIGSVTEFTTRTMTAIDIGAAVINDSATNTTQTWSSSFIQGKLDAINTAIIGGVINKGGYNASTNTPDLGDATPIPGIKNGWMYTVTTAGSSFFGVPLQPGDTLIANQDNPTAVGHWTIVQSNVDQATTTVLGLVMLAVAADVTAGTANGKAVTPDLVKGAIDARVVQATETVAGIAEIATQAECTTGTDDLRIVTPLKMKNYVASVVPGSTPDADESTRGKVEIATQAEVDAGVVDSPYAVSPLKLKTLLGGATRKVSQLIGNGSLTSFTITHNWATNEVNTTVLDATTGEEVIVEWLAGNNTSNAVTVNVNVAPTTNQYKVIVNRL